MNIVFEADLSSHVAHRPALLNFIVRTATDAGGAGMAFLRAIKPWSNWMLTQGYREGQVMPALFGQPAARRQQSARRARTSHFII